MVRIPAFSRIMVTGADGFVGRHLLPALTAAASPGAEISLASRTGEGEAGYPVVMMELKDPASVEAAVAAIRPDLVIHLAAQASVGQSWGAAADTWDINLCGSLHLARAVAEHVPRSAFFYVSTAEVYGSSFNDGDAVESTPLRPQSAYSRSKAAAEGMLADVLPDSATLIVARPSNHSGAGQDARFVIPSFAAQIARIEQGAAEHIRVGNLEAERDFMDVRDVVEAYIGLLARTPSLPPRAIFNIGTGHSVRIGDILDRLRAMSGVPTPVVPDPDRMRPSEIARTVIDAGALRAATGWRPAHALDEMLATVLNEQRARLSSAGK